MKIRSRGTRIKRDIAKLEAAVDCIERALVSMADNLRVMCLIVPSARGLKAA